MGLSIKNGETERAIRELADLTGESMTGAVTQAVRERLDRLRSDVEVNDILATKFYSFWKPLQLWRLGWPQRVLMDEGLRAMAVFGPMYWMTGPGAESVAVAAGNTPAWIRKQYRTHKNGKVNIADGPLAFVIGSGTPASGCCIARSVNVGRLANGVGILAAFDGVVKFAGLRLQGYVGNSVAFAE